MKQVSIREAGKNISKLLRDLPVEITNHGRPIAWLIEPSLIVPEWVAQADPPVEKPKINFDSATSDFSPTAQKFVDAAIEEKKKLPFNGGPCFHKALPGMCRVDWCPNYREKK